MRAATLAILALALIACESTSEPDRKAEDVLRDYLDAVTTGQYELAHRQLATVDQKALRPADLAARVPGTGEYRIGRVHRYPDITTVDVEFTGPDDPQPESAGATAVAPAPAHQSFSLLREPHGWRVLLSAQTSADRSGLAPAAAAGAPDSPGSSDPPAPSDLPAAPDTTAANAPPTDLPEPPAPVATTARGIDVYALKAGHYRTALGRTVPGVEFKLRNRSSDTVALVAVTVYFQDRRGRTISEETYYPVRSDGAGFLNTPPLKPGYLWQLERGKFFLAEAVPSEWQRGAVTAAITQLRFAGESTATVLDAGPGQHAGIP